MNPSKEPPISTDSSELPNDVSAEEREASLKMLIEYMQRKEQPPSPELQAKRARLLKILSSSTSSIPRKG